MISPLHKGSNPKFPFSFVRIDNPGDYDNENIVFRAEEDIDSLSRCFLIYCIEDIETGLPDSNKTRILTFANIKINKGVKLVIHTRSNEDSNSIEIKKIERNKISLYWGLETPIWDVPLSYYEFILGENSIAGGLLRD